VDFKSRKEQNEPTFCGARWTSNQEKSKMSPFYATSYTGTPQNATQIKQPGKIVAFEELGGFENIGEERVVATSSLWKRPRQIRICWGSRFYWNIT